MGVSPEHIEGGFILVARKLFLGEIMGKPPLYFKLWVWMLDRANWKDRDKLKRGQFVTTITDMQEAMSYYSGYRKVTPTKDEIRGAYGAFREAAMITTAKTTRGMVVTVVNYDSYQAPENYGPRTGPRNGNAAEPTVTPHDTEEGLKKGKKEKNTLPPDASRLSGMLADLILGNNALNVALAGGKRVATIARWAADIDKLNRVDGQAWGNIEAVIGWCQADSFWSSNILSGKKLREQFDQLTAKMSAKHSVGHGRQVPGSGITREEEIADLHAKGVFS